MRKKAFDSSIYVSLTFECAIFKWISSVSSWAWADWVVVVSNSAFSICSACIWTRIFTFHVDTCLIVSAICTEETFWFAWAEWISNIVAHTFTDSTAIQHKTLSVFSTRWWVARIFWWSWDDLDLVTSDEWITSETSTAVTDWVVSNHRALGIDTTGTDTWVYTFVSDAS